MSHLARLSSAGLTHVHLLPCFHFGSADDIKSTWEAPRGDLSEWPADSEEQQQRVGEVADKDGFNWG